jgi:hypothetical protein
MTVLRQAGLQSAADHGIILDQQNSHNEGSLAQIDDDKTIGALHAITGPRLLFAPMRIRRQAAEEVGRFSAVKMNAGLLIRVELGRK